jgi:hypothetical protein
MSRLMLAALLSSLPAALMAQAQRDASGVVRPPSGAALTSALAAEGHLAPICDGSEIRRLERRRNIGGVLVLGTLAADALVLWLSRGDPSPAEVPRNIDRDRRAMAIIIGSLPIALVGLHINQNSHPGETFWQQTLARMKVGETRSADVRACLRAPSATSSTGAEETWTYFTTRPDAWRYGGSLRTVSFTFKDGVLAEVRRSEVNRLPGQAWPVTEPVPAVIPVPPSLEAAIPPPR